MIDQPSILSQFDLKGYQKQAASDDNPAIAVTAGAGSGKTRTLVGRYLRLLENGYPIRSLVAITFTDKAAREMRSRIRAEIEKWFNSPTLAQGEESGVWQTTFGELDAARIGTIHSLCAEILRAHPAEAGIDPNFSVLEEGLAAALKAQAVELALVWAANHPQVAGLFGIFKEGELRQILGSLLNRRLDIVLGEGGSSPLKGWSARVEAWLSSRLSDPTWRDSLENLATLRADQPDDRLELSRREVLAAWYEVEEVIPSRDWDAALAKLAGLRKAISTGGRKDNWSPADLEAARQAMRTLREYFDHGLKPLAGGDSTDVRWALDERAAFALPALGKLIDQLCQEYERLKDEQRALDFDDLEGKAARLLTENESVRTRWQREIRAVLVDEFQDTNDRQRQIVYALSGFISRLSDPIRPSANQSASLFIVGDAKQSIYKFRGADVAVFRKVQADIAAAEGLPIDLDLTFRTHEPLLKALNALLSPVLGERDDPHHPFQVPFAPLRAYRQAPDSEAVTAPYVEFFLGLGEDAAAGRAAAAAALAGRMHQLHEQEGFEWGDMALLFRASSAFEVYENALETAGIPFVTVAGRGFYDRPEIRDMLNALAAVADPTDDLAMAGLLRSPAIGLSDAELYRLRFPNDNGKPVSLWETLSWELESAPAGQLRALIIIADLYALVGRASAAEVLKRYLDLTGYHTMLGMAPGGSRLQRNVDKLLADAHRSRMVNLEDFLAYVQALRDVGTREGEAAVEAEGAVQLMTVHKAKGLEFPLVVIADAAYQPPAWSAPVLLDDQMGLLLGLRDPNGARPVAWKLGSLAEAEREEAEDKRLLYVAATRAKEKLIINGHVKRLKAGNLNLGGWLGRLGEVIGLDKIQLAGEVDVPQKLDVTLSPDAGEIMCMLCPLLPDLLSSPKGALIRRGEITAASPEVRAFPDLAAPLQIPEILLLDEKVIARESDPPQRVWRIVPRAKHPTGPAWVVGKLVHEAIRRWRFPGDGFEDFITPYALEAGLTDPAEIRATIHSVERLLDRFRAHPLWAEMNAAERYHEVPYALPGDRGIIDLLYRSDNGWVIADFKTDEVRSETEMWATIEQNAYHIQVKRYAEAVTVQLGERPRMMLVFLQVGHGKIIAKEIT